MKTYEDLIKIYESYDALYKQAAASTVINSLNTAQKVTDAVKDVGLVGLKATIIPTLLGIPLTAAALGAGASAVSSPYALSENADKYIVRSALDSEIAVMERKIAEELVKRGQVKEKKYDRFV